MLFGPERGSTFTVSSHLRQGAIIIRVGGELDFRSVPVLREQQVREKPPIAAEPGQMLMGGIWLIHRAQGTSTPCRLVLGRGVGRRR
jgi:hypothetical protein